jgi:hypothetical protein
MERLDPALNAIVQKDAASAWRAAASSDPREPNPNPRAIEVKGKQRPISIRCRGPASSLVPLCRPPSLRRCFGGLPRGVQSIAGDFEDRTAIACDAMLETRGGGFQTPPMASP